MKNFKHIKAWQLGKLIATSVYQLAGNLSEREQRVFATQIARSAVAIPTNIAEGNGRRNSRDYGRHLETALGFSFELETQLIILQELHVGDAEKVADLITLAVEEQKMLYDMLKKLNYN